MFKMPAYDPVPSAVIGCGILLAAALAFAFFCSAVVSAKPER
jgi:hypothetical protein